MIELVHVQRFTLGTEWTDIDREIIRRKFGALTMAAHDTTDYINMSANARMGMVGRLALASAEEI